jgi:hypothetical protein
MKAQNLPFWISFKFKSLDLLYSSLKSYKAIKICQSFTFQEILNQIHTFVKYRKTAILLQIFFQ